MITQLIGKDLNLGAHFEAVANLALERNAVPILLNKQVYKTENCHF